MESCLFLILAKDLAKTVSLKPLQKCLTRFFVVVLKKVQSHFYVLINKFLDISIDEFLVTCVRVDIIIL